ncbi:MAG: PD40 domain-containing protein [Ignavibacteriales bacterium]|nr:PD40 domain-containing protein [Ignavibacteriales bacterium]
MKQLFLASLVLMLEAPVQVHGQLRITATERLPIDPSGSWGSPRFSPDGQSVFFTDADNNGIWEYALRTRAVRQITADPQAGGTFNISSDGSQIVYRRTTYDRTTKSRKQAIVIRGLLDNSTRVVATGRSVSVPVFSQNAVVYSIQGRTNSLSAIANATEVAVLGIEETKIALNRNGKKVILDPMKNGSYIWPALSPDRQRIVAYEMDRGTFVCDVQGKVISKLNRRDAAVWSRSGNWLIYMDDKDDGHRMMSSDLHAVSPDGKRQVQLTFTNDIMEVYPNCSPTENKIVCTSLEGALYLLSYEEEE